MKGYSNSFVFSRTIRAGMLAAQAVAALAMLGAAGGEDTSAPFVFKRAGAVDIGMKEIHGIAIDGSDRLYAAGTDGIKVFDSEGKALRSIKTSGPARCVAVGPDGAIYAGLNARVETFAADGATQTAWGKEGKEPGDFSVITGMAVSGLVLYVTDGGNRRLLKFSTDGDFIEETRGFVIPSAHFDCAVDAQGILYIAHTGKWRIERYGPNGKMIGWWGESGTVPEKFCGCCNPTNFALFPDGRVATTEKGIPRMKVYDATGKMLAYLGPEAFRPDAEGMDLAVDSKGRVAVLDPAGGKVAYYELIPGGRKVR